MPRKVPLESFRIRPSKRSMRYFIVHVAETIDDMHVIQRRYAGGFHPDGIALCLAGESRHPACRGLLGMIFFAKTHCDAGIVAHELLHAAFRTVEREGKRVQHWQHQPMATSSDFSTNADEEHLAAILEHLTAHFWRQAARRGYGGSRHQVAA